VAERIEGIWQRSRRSYGAPRIDAMLARDGIRWAGNEWSGECGKSASGVHPYKHWKIA
jgi:hypothetical protein